MRWMQDPPKEMPVMTYENLLTDSNLLWKEFEEQKICMIFYMFSTSKYIICMCRNLRNFWYIKKVAPCHENIFLNLSFTRKVVFSFMPWMLYLSQLDRRCGRPKN
jgi:hypothetical protein